MATSNPRVVPSTQLKTRSVSTQRRSRGSGFLPAQDQAPLPESVFHSMLALEHRRAERSSNAFVLLLLDAKLGNGAAAGILKKAVDVALITKRETDLMGWYLGNAILGIIFTGVNMEGNPPITETLRLKIETALIEHLGRSRAAKIAISLHLFPGRPDKNQSDWAADSEPFPDADRKGLRRRLSEVVNL